MSLSIFVLILFAALLHASWNAIIKRGGRPVFRMVSLTVAHSFVGVCFLPFARLPNEEEWLWLGLSGLIHCAYQLLLAVSYQHGDLSRVYPISRGGAPMLLALVGVFALEDRLNFWQYVGVFTISCGILMMAYGVFLNKEHRALIPFALLTASATMGYTLVDGLGSRVYGDALGYLGWLFLISMCLFIPCIWLWKGKEALSGKAIEWREGFFAGTVSFVAYAIPLYAMTQAPIVLVGALRESSVLFAVLIGVLFFKEKLDRAKIFGVILILSGIIALRLLH